MAFSCVREETVERVGHYAAACGDREQLVKHWDAVFLKYRSGRTGCPVSRDFTTPFCKPQKQSEKKRTKEEPLAHPDLNRKCSSGGTDNEEACKRQNIENDDVL